MLIASWIDFNTAQNNCQQGVIFIFLAPFWVKLSARLVGQAYGGEIITMTKQEIDVPVAWQQLDLARPGEIVLVIGAPDVGKSSFAQYLYRRLCREAGRVAFLDGDPGQSTLGPPTTMTLAIGDSFPPQGPHWRNFVGAVSPRGHMLPLVVGASRLVQAARQAGVETIVYDTCGLVDPAYGGTALKLAKIELLQPVVVCAIQRNRELRVVAGPSAA